MTFFQMDAENVQFEGKIRRYVFKKPWTDKKLVMKFVMGEQTFTDSEGRAVLVFEEDEAGYGQWSKASENI